MHETKQERGSTYIMQISRHWRLNSQRYRLEGVRLQNGDVRLQNRPADDAQPARELEAAVPATAKQVPVRLGS